MQGNALNQNVFELVWQFRLKAAADGKLAFGGDLGFCAGYVDAFCGRLKRDGQQNGQQQQFNAFV
ncbi:hypothetical protein l11_20930 [Neisseria weaveri LMG 5135]|nr:hypothetical protein l11_20930 [Neisseria weaveri LMG 5135]